MGVRVLSHERRNIDPAALIVENDDAKRAVLLKMLLKPMEQSTKVNQLAQSGILAVGVFAKIK